MLFFLIFAKIRPNLAHQKFDFYIRFCRGDLKIDIVMIEIEIETEIEFFTYPTPVMTGPI